MVVAVCVLYLAGDVFALKDSQVNKYISAINELNEKYGVTVSVRVIDPEKANQLSDNEINQKLHTLEEKLIIGQKALKENNMGISIPNYRGYAGESNTGPCEYCRQSFPI